MSPPPAFSGFAPAAFAWFEGLAAHNTREWFAEHRETYEGEVRGPLEALLEELADDGAGGRVKLFRQHRDVRFSADKSPYKTTTYGVIADRPESEASLYLQLGAEGLFAGTGYYDLAPDQLRRLREAIADAATGPALEAAVASAAAKGVELFGATLKTAPRGYARDHPRVGLLRHKLLVAGARLPPGRITRTAALAHARGSWSALASMNAWLDEHVGASRLPPRVRR